MLVFCHEINECAMRVPEFILLDFMNHMDQAGYLYFCENDIETSSEESSGVFLALRKLAVILYEWIDNERFDLKAEYREVLNSKKMLSLIEGTLSGLGSGQIEVHTADPHEDIALFLKQAHACFSRIQAKENQSAAWRDYLQGENPDFKDIPYSFEDTEGQTCSFCEKTSEEVENIIAGPKAHICNECVGLCNNVLAEDE